MPLLKRLAEAAITGLTLLGVYLAVVQLDVVWQVAVLIGIAAFVWLATLTTTGWLHLGMRTSPRERRLRIIGDALLISAGVIFALDTGGAWLLLAWLLAIGGGIAGYAEVGSHEGRKAE